MNEGEENLKSDRFLELSKRIKQRSQFIAGLQQRQLRLFRIFSSEPPREMSRVDWIVKQLKES